MCVDSSTKLRLAYHWRDSGKYGRRSTHDANSTLKVTACSEGQRSGEAITSPSPDTFHCTGSAVPSNATRLILPGTRPRDGLRDGIRVSRGLCPMTNAYRAPDLVVNR